LKGEKDMTTKKSERPTTEEKSTETPTRPIKVCRSGAIAASVWRRQTATGFEYLDFSLSRSWKTKNGQKEGYSQSFFERNEDALIAVIQEAVEFICAYPLETQPVPGEDHPLLHGPNGTTPAVAQ
jgi:hypothetical protein